MAELRGSISNRCEPDDRGEITLAELLAKAEDGASEPRVRLSVTRIDVRLG
jgi:hypothetical protein